MGARPRPRGGSIAFTGFIRASLACWFHVRTTPEFGGSAASTGNTFPPPMATDVTTMVPAAANVLITRCLMMVPPCQGTSLSRAASCSDPRLMRCRSGNITRSSDCPSRLAVGASHRSRDVSELRSRQAGCIDVRIEVSFSRFDPPEGRACRVGDADGPQTIEEQAFVGWLGLLGVLQLLADGSDEPQRR